MRGFSFLFFPQVQRLLESLPLHSATKALDIVLNWGVKPSVEPTLVRAGKVQLVIDSPLEGYTLYAVDTDGTRLFEVPIRSYGAKQSVLNLSVHNKQGSVLAYELVKE